MSPSQSVTTKKTSARKSLRQFLETLKVKTKTAVRRFCAAKSKQKTIRYGSMLWSSIPKQRIHTKINQQVKKYFYNWILQHTQVLVSPIAKDSLKLYIDGQVEPDLVTKLLFQVLLREINNIMVSPP